MIHWSPDRSAVHPLPSGCDVNAAHTFWTTEGPSKCLFVFVLQRKTCNLGPSGSWKASEEEEEPVGPRLGILNTTINMSSEDVSRIQCTSCSSNASRRDQERLKCMLFFETTFFFLLFFYITCTMSQHTLQYKNQVITRDLIFFLKSAFSRPQ